MNGDPVLFAAVDTTKGATYSFACALCGRHRADQPDTLCPDCTKSSKPAKRTTSAPSRRRAVKSRA